MATRAPGRGRLRSAAPAAGGATGAASVGRTVAFMTDTIELFEDRRQALPNGEHAQRDVARGSGAPRLPLSVYRREKPWVEMLLSSSMYVNGNLRQ